MSIEIEEWRDIPGYEGNYMVSNIGNVKSLNRYISSIHPKTMLKYKYLRKGITLKKCINTHGYHYVSLHSVKHRVHRLVAAAFLKEYSEDLHVDHIDNDRTNNNIDNIRMCTRSQNNRNYNQHKKTASGYVGVSKHAEKCFIAKVMKDGIVYHGKYRKTAIEAAVDHDVLVKKLHGDFATFNFS